MKKTKTRRWRPRKRIHKRRLPKTPIETVIAAGTIPFTPAEESWESPFDYMQKGDWRGVSESLQSGFLGMNTTTHQIDLWRALNPFDMNKARYSKMLIMGTVIGIVRRKFTAKYTDPLMNRIPLIGRRVG